VRVPVPGPAIIEAMTRDDAEAFARSWLEAWNAHDLDAVLSHFGEEVLFSSPHAQQLLPGSDGVIRDKAALRAYWEAGLRRIPDLRFELLGVYVGVDTLVINYRNQKGGLANEVLTFEGPVVVQGHGTYLEPEPYHRARP
jgi:ketosteroid isomerase-like protein